MHDALLGSFGVIFLIQLGHRLRQDLLIVFVNIPFDESQKTVNKWARCLSPRKAIETH